MLGHKSFESTIPSPSESFDGRVSSENSATILISDSTVNEKGLEVSDISPDHLVNS